MAVFLPFFSSFQKYLLALSCGVACLFLFASGKVQAQGKPQVVQLTGIVTAGDSLYGLPGASVYVPKAGRGTTTNQYGYFSLAVLAGDSVIVSSIGYKAQSVIIPKRLKSQSYSIIVEMKEDPLILPEVRIFPYSTEELFKRAFLSLKLPDEDQRAVAKNLNEGILERMMSDAPMTPNNNFRNQMSLQQQQEQRRYLYPTIPITAWYELIQAIKRGDFKKK
ncbi:carboxypeptidase-like regulatory domain-containing protein [Adhaeribacter soli]|uniref:Carboxypeptidase-like regulatory domain-containing protein n=1 Tax=Adhaeribacter soli TaxID=2607655 RepID=A0A5N1J8C9_9BACT|nr:carboxypeptidase-like regulatory domain-containing protein [Adhaeribacter soli]KAA9340931.1 carboxypeptidase-like regulatory domain-containing protein [Adhaeribacter soli]